MGTSKLSEKLYEILGCLLLVASCYGNQDKLRKLWATCLVRQPSNSSQQNPRGNLLWTSTDPTEKETQYSHSCYATETGISSGPYGRAIWPGSRPYKISIASFMKMLRVFMKCLKLQCSS